MLAGINPVQWQRRRSTLPPCCLPARTCAVQISPVKDAACAEPAASYWSSMKIKAHYVTPALIATSLNTASTNLTRWVRCTHTHGAASLPSLCAILATPTHTL